MGSTRQERQILMLPEEHDDEEEQQEEPAQEQSIDWAAAVLPFVFPALGGLLYGYDTGATSGALVSIQDAAVSGTDWYELSPLQVGLVVSGSLAGSLIGSILAFVVADCMGRRRELVVAALAYFVGSSFMSLAPSLPVLIFGRLCYGLGMGLTMHAAPIYIAETSPQQIRGMLVAMKEFLIVTGMLLGYAISYLFIIETAGWRRMYGCVLPVSLLMAVGMWSLPPSPRWLLLRGAQLHDRSGEYEKQAALAFRRLHGVGVSQDWIEKQLAEMSSLQQPDPTAGEERRSNGGVRSGYAKLFTKANLQGLTVGIGIAFFQQATGQPSVVYYAASILLLAGFSEAQDATRTAMGLGLVKVIMTLATVATVDKLGRRPLILTGVSGLTVCLFILAWYFSFGMTFPHIGVTALLCYVGFYQISFGPIGMLLTSEIFALRVRGRAQSVTAMVNFSMNTLVTLLFPLLEATIGSGSTFLGFAVIATAAAVFVYLMVPETKGMSLEEIERITSVGNLASLG